LSEPHTYKGLYGLQDICEVCGKTLLRHLEADAEIDTFQTDNPLLSGEQCRPFAERIDCLKSLAPSHTKLSSPQRKPRLHKLKIAAVIVFVVGLLSWNLLLTGYVGWLQYQSFELADRASFLESRTDAAFSSIRGAFEQISLDLAKLAKQNKQTAEKAETALQNDDALALAIMKLSGNQIDGGGPEKKDNTLTRSIPPDSNWKVEVR
jgi:hypothetical protein